MDMDLSVLYTHIDPFAILLGVISVIFFVLWFRASRKASKVDSLHDLISNIEKVRDEAISELEVLRDIKHQAEINERLAMQKLDMMKSQMEDWERTKEEHLKAAKASMMEATSTLSSKLLEDHKRENEQVKKESEERVKKTTEELHQKFQNVFESMRSLSDQVSNFGTSVDVIQNSLLNPQGAGMLAEVALENLLKNSGLEKGRDYELQYTVESEEGGRKLRPDAVVFLPGDSALVIDSKSSKFFLESGKSDGVEANKDQELKTSMNKHLNDLISKDYKTSVEADLKSSKHKIMSSNIHTVMFLPTDVALEKLRSVDAKFFDAAYSKKIIPVGPSGLVNILMQAKVVIERVKQEENYHNIMELVEKMIDSVANMHTHAEAVGKSLNSSLDKYNKFVGSFNSGFVSKVRKIKELGISANKRSEVPKLSKYETLKTSNLDE